jgi:hypothetical protein
MTNGLSRNVCPELPLYVASNSGTAQLSTFGFLEEREYLDWLGDCCILCKNYASLSNFTFNERHTVFADVGDQNRKHLNAKPLSHLPYPPVVTMQGFGLIPAAVNNTNTESNKEMCHCSNNQQNVLTTAQTQISKNLVYYTFFFSQHPHVRGF